MLGFSIWLVYQLYCCSVGSGFIVTAEYYGIFRLKQCQLSSHRFKPLVLEANVTFAQHAPGLKPSSSHQPNPFQPNAVKPLFSRLKPAQLPDATLVISFSLTYLLGWEVFLRS
jgi:hypothetical protein